MLGAGFFCAAAAIALGMMVFVSSETRASSNSPGLHDVEGLWRHDDLITSDGKHIPLNGVFLFHDGVFVEQAVMNDGAKPSGMAHAGPYTPTADGVELIAEQTIGLSADETPRLSFRHSTHHVLHVNNSGDKMVLRFGSGTVQTFTRIGSGRATIYNLTDGRFALVDGRFVLVAGNENGVITGYGTYRANGTDYDLRARRWAEGNAEKAIIRSDLTIRVRFDGRALTLSDGRRFQVTE